MTVFYRTLRQTELAKIRINPQRTCIQIAINPCAIDFVPARVSQRHLCADEFAYENAADTAPPPDQVVAYRSAVETFSEAVDKMERCSARCLFWRESIKSHIGKLLCACTFRCARWSAT